MPPFSFFMEEKELLYWIEWFENRPIRDPFMLEFIRAARAVLEKLEGTRAD